MGTKQSITVTRRVAAAPERVFAAFTVPDEIRQWHVPGPAYHVSIADFEPGVGGAIRIGMQGPERAEPHVFYGTILEVEAPRRLVYTSSWEPPDRDTGETQVTIELAAADSGTDVTVTHEGLPDEESAADHTRGWTGSLESLERYLA